MDRIPGVRVFTKGASYYWRKFKRRKNFNFEEVLRPLLDEVSSAGNGDLPGEPRDRRTEWDNIGEEVRYNMPDKTVSLGDDYQDKLQETEQHEQKRVNLGQQFISRLPGGKRNGEDFQVTTGVASQRGPTPHPHKEPVLGDFDSWLKQYWSAFNQSQNESEFRANIESLAAKHATEFSQDAIRYWEDSQGHPDWEATLWNLYDTGSLKAYHKTLENLEEHRNQMVTISCEFETELKKLN